jgi:hypothetical protein
MEVWLSRRKVLGLLLVERVVCEIDPGMETRFH